MPWRELGAELVPHLTLEIWNKKNHRPGGAEVQMEKSDRIESNLLIFPHPSFVPFSNSN